MKMGNASENYGFDSLDEAIEKAEAGDIDDWVIASILFINTNKLLSEDTINAVDFIEWAASKGNGRAMCEMGKIYGRGLFGVREDAEICMNMFKASAEAGYPEGAFNYAMILEELNELKEAQKNFLKASEYGHGESMYHLGLLYHSGKGGVKDYDMALRYLLSATELGCVPAQQFVGKLYYYGSEGLNKDYSTAFKYLTMAAENGDVYSQSLLGTIYSQGKGCEINQREARKYFQLAAEQGDSYAQHNLGIICLNYFKEYKEAMKWFSVASRNGFGFSSLFLGFMHYEGIGTCPDLYSAYDHFVMASEQGCSDAENIIQKIKAAEPIKILSHYLKIEDNENNDKMNEAYLSFHADDSFLNMRSGLTHLENKEYNKAIECFHEASENGNVQAQHMLGLLYFQGYGISPDYDKCLKYFNAAASRGYDKSLFHLGQIYSEGEIVEQDHGKALEFFKAAADLGNDGALNDMGVMFTYGYGVDADYDLAEKYFLEAVERGSIPAVGNLAMLYSRKGENEKALKYTRISAEKGDPKSQYNMGMICLKGEEIQRDMNEAVSYLKSSSENGNPNAQYVLGKLYYNGDGVEKNYSEAAKYLNLAAEQGHAHAQYFLGMVFFPLVIFLKLSHGF